MTAVTFVTNPPIRRTCRECGAKLVVAVTLDETRLVENRDCPGCGAQLRPLDRIELERIEAQIEREVLRNA